MRLALVGRGYGTLVLAQRERAFTDCKIVTRHARGVNGSARALMAFDGVRWGALAQPSWASASRSAPSRGAGSTSCC
jgi:hypothetical protein